MRLGTMLALTAFLLSACSRGNALLGTWSTGNEAGNEKMTFLEDGTVRVESPRVTLMTWRMLDDGRFTITGASLAGMNMTGCLAGGMIKIRARDSASGGEAMLRYYRLNADGSPVTNSVSGPAAGGGASADCTP